MPPATAQQDVDLHRASTLQADPGRSPQRHQSEGVDESERPARDKSGEGNSETRHRQGESPRASGADGIARESIRTTPAAEQINQGSHPNGMKSISPGLRLSRRSFAKAEARLPWVNVPQNIPPLLAKRGEGRGEESKSITHVRP